LMGSNSYPSDMLRPAYEVLLQLR